MTETIEEFKERVDKYKLYGNVISEEVYAKLAEYKRGKKEEKEV